jgi:hypothetical protein
MAKLIYSVGTKTKMNIGAFIFEQTLRHGRSEAVKLPIAFPTLLTGIILDQQPIILSAADVPKKRESPLTLHFKLFESRHVADLVGASASASTTATAGTGLMTRKEIVAALKDTCKYLDERKALFERMILALENEEAAEGDDPEGVGLEEAQPDEEDEVAEEEEEAGDEEEDMETDA